MNNFTYENTKNATHIYFNSTVGAIFRTDKCYMQGEMGSMSRSFDKIPYWAQKLSRPQNETREHWTTNGVTQYAQGNNMNTDKLIPISYVKKFTPLVAGDVLYNNQCKKQFIANDYDIDVIATIELEDNFLFIISFADRPNTGTQPVGDDVVVDANWNNNAVIAQDRNWKIYESDETWKPNYDAMLKQCQAEQLAELMLKEGDTIIIRHSNYLSNPPVTNQIWDVVPVGSGVGKGEHLCANNELKITKATSCINPNDLEAVPDKTPVFTQAMADAGELLTVGMLFTTETGNTYTVDAINIKSICFTDEDGFFVGIPVGKVKPIKTDEDKLRKALSDIWCKSCSVTEGVDSYMNSDKFTIILKV